MLHQTNELLFERPSNLHDRTAHVFAVGDDGPTPFTVVITKSAVEPAETTATMLAKIETELSRSLERFRVTERADGMVAGQAAKLLHFEWVQNGAQLYQKQAAFIAPLAQGPALIQIAATATAEATADYAAGFNAMLASVRLHLRTE